MSVTVDDSALMPVARRPKWIASGLSEDTLFSLEADAIAAPLETHVQSRAHGLIRPRAPMPLPDYEGSLAATRPRWTMIGSMEERP